MKIFKNKKIVIMVYDEVKKPIDTDALLRYYENTEHEKPIVLRIYDDTTAGIFY